MIHLLYTAFEYYLYSIVFRHISFFLHYYHYNIYDIVLIYLHRTTGPSHCLFFVIRNIFVVRKTGKTETIRGFCLIISHTPPNNTDEHCVFVVYIQKGKRTTLIFIPLRFV